MKKIVALCGATAVGKTEYALEIAEQLNAEIVSCDSVQVYKGMDIGSAKPNQDERNRIRHHLIDIINPSDKFTVADYQKLAMEAIDDIISRGKIPLISGGTGLYLDSIIFDMDFAAEPERDETYRKKLYEIAEEKGAQYLHDILRTKDINAAQRIHPNNIKRVVRALEAIEVGTPLSDFAKDLKRNKTIFHVLVGLKRDREELYERINERVDILVDRGLIDEVSGLIESGISMSATSMSAIGYKEVVSYLKDEITLDEAIELIKKNTRHYAKRQSTWFKRYDDMKWFDISKDYASVKRDNMEEIISWVKRKL